MVVSLRQAIADEECSRPPNAPHIENIQCFEHANR